MISLKQKKLLKANINYLYTEQNNLLKSCFQWIFDISLILIVKLLQVGFRPHYLRFMLSNGLLLMKDKSLKFEIKDCYVPRGGAESCDVYWKVRNVGSEEIRLNQIRGQIEKTDSKIHRGHTLFWGAHYMECYLVKNGVCIARDRIEVLIQ